MISSSVGCSLNVVNMSREVHVYQLKLSETSIFSPIFWPNFWLLHVSIKKKSIKFHRELIDFAHGVTSEQNFSLKKHKWKIFSTKQVFTFEWFFFKLWFSFWINYIFGLGFVMQSRKFRMFLQTWDFEEKVCMTPELISK